MALANPRVGGSHLHHDSCICCTSAGAERFDPYGAYIGLLAGGSGTVCYALHHHHDLVALVGGAYTLAIFEAALGALIGPLRWAQSIHQRKDFGRYPCRQPAISGGHA
jgi:hypothetical protein